MLLGGAIAASLICACTTMPASDPGVAPLAIPGTWAAGGAAQGLPASVLAQWWDRFDDPLLGRLVDASLRANTSVLSARAALAQASALRGVAAAALWPTVDASASARRATAGGHSTGSTVEAGIDAAWAPDVFGANRQALAAADATLQASAATLGDVQVQIAAEVGLAYILLRSSQARLRIAADNLASQRDTLQITEWRAQAGLVTALETVQARAAAEQTAAQLPALRGAIEQAGHALAVLTGQPPAALAATLAVEAPVPTLAQAITLAIPADTLRQRADVRAAEHQVVAALARVRQADAQRLPNFSIAGSLGLSAATLGGLASSTALVTSVLAGIALPVFDAGSARAQVRVQQAALEQADAAYRAVVLKALKDVEDALVALRGDRERAAQLGLAAADAARAGDLARQRYAAGLVDFQVVLDTQRTRLAVQDSLAASTADVGSDEVRLFQALGGGWGGADASAPTPAGRRESRVGTR